MVRAYRELRYLLSALHKSRHVTDADFASWSEQVAADWTYMHLPHYH